MELTRVGGAGEEGRGLIASSTARTEKWFLVDNGTATCDFLGT